MGTLDLIILALYFIASLAIGLWFGRGEQNTHDFFLGGRRQHWLLAGMSIVATEVSALTLIAVPAEAFRGDWWYLQMYAGAFAGRMLILLILLPAFYAGSVTTVYEFLGQRFGPWTRVTASMLFIVSRVIGSGMRLLVASLAIAEIFGWNLYLVICGAALVAMTYTTFGGIRAILWTDLFQACLFLGAAGAVIFFLFGAIPGTWAENLSAAADAGKLHVFTWSSDPNNVYSFWVLAIHATFLNMAALGVDQDLTQRMLTCSDVRRGQRSLLFNAFAGLPIVCTFLLIGTLLFLYFQHAEGAALPSRVQEKTDLVFPYFIATALPAGSGLRGLLVAAIFAASMSSLSSAIGALSSTVVTDLYRPFRRREKSEAHYLRAARLTAFLFGVVLAGMAVTFAGHDRLLVKVFELVGLIFGGLLGVFLLGILTKTRGHDRLNVAAMLSSVGLLVALKLVQEANEAVWIAWPWWVVIGTVWTFGLGACARSTLQTVRRKGHAN